MKEKFGDEVELSIYTNDSREAASYSLNASATVFVDDEAVSLDTALSEEKMEEFLKER